MRLAFCLFLLFAAHFTEAQAQQIIVNYGSTAEELAEAIAGNGVQILNPVLTCADSASGQYTISGVPGFPEGPGIVLSTGNIGDVRGPNTSQSTTTEWNTPGDATITQIAGNTSFDACALEFDVVPVGDTLRFNFTFASEEYSEYVGTPFNDVFGFFISGPGIAGDPGLNGLQNIALVPGTNQAVGINTVNNGNPDIAFPAVNPEFFVNNPLGFSNLIQYDGWTQNLFAQRVVNPCDTFRLKLVIADVADREWDSSVFIEAIESNSISLTASTAGGIESMIEGCNNGTVTFTRIPVTSEPVTVTYFIGGTAINGGDYAQIGDADPLEPKFITIPANEASADLLISPIADGIDEGPETVTFFVGNPLCPGTVQDSLIFIIKDSLDVSINPILSFVCLGDSLTFDVESDATDFFWTPATYLNDPTLMEPTATPNANITYTLTASAAGCSSIALGDVFVTDIDLSANVNPILCGGANDGSIDLTIIGGESPLEIEWVGPNGFSSSNADISSLSPGTYVVLVTDRDGCTASLTVEITEVPAMNVQLESPVFIGGDNISCFLATDGQINTSVSGGTAPYEFLWNDADSQTGATATNLAAGTYSVIVTDANGCAAEANIELTQPEPISGDLIDRTDVLCTGDASGSATIEGTGGNGPFNYLWNTVPPQSGTTATGLPAGFVSVTITDINGCTGNIDIEISEPAEALSGSIISENVLCNGESTGTAVADIAGGTSPYVYSWSSSPGVDGAEISGVAAGNYLLTVTDANGCELLLPYNIVQPAPLSLDLVTLSNAACNGEPSGSATVIASGGTGPYIYSWSTDPVINGPSANGLPAGNYTVTASDINGCQVDLEVVISEPEILSTDIAILSLPSCHNSADGSLEALVSGGTGPYSFQWNTIPPQNGSVLAGLEGGNYEVNVTDANGCTAVTSLELLSPDELIISVDQIENVLCHGASTGSATISIDGGTSPYNILWDDALLQTTATATQLQAGTYTVNVTDQNGCTANLSLVISQPPGPLTVTIDNAVNIPCFGESTGSATAQASGGSGNYSYQWNDPNSQTTATASNLPAGTYTVTVFDNNGCEIPATEQVIITEPAAALEATITELSSIICANDSTASLEVAITGGTGPYTILWDLPGLDTSSDAIVTDLAAGNYSVLITDANGCGITEDYTILQSEPIVITFTSTPSLCFGTPSGTIDLEINGGVPPYTVNWAGPGGFVSSDLSLTDLEGGVYNLAITDDIGCTLNDAVTVVQPDNLVITVDSISDYNGFNTSCYNSFDGAIFITPSGGTEPYSYQWNEPGNPNFSNQQDVANLNAGTYEAVVFDANGCIQNEFIDILSPESLDVAFNPSVYGNGFNISCNGAADGSIEAVPSGGIPDYNFTWIGPGGFGPVMGNPIDNLGPGEYSLLLQDSEGCIYFESIVLTSPAPFNINLIASTINGSNVSCNGASDGAIDLIVQGGQAPFTYTWTGPNGFSASSQDIANLPAGEYCVAVLDALNCTREMCITLIEPEPLEIVLTPSIYFNGLNLNCDDSMDGSISTSITGGTANYQISWTGPSNFTSTATDITGLGEGNYCLTVVDANGCEETACIELVAPDPIQIELTSSIGLACNGDDTASLDITVIGGDPAYNYSWSGPAGFTSSDEDISNLAAGTYCLTIEDANNCTAQNCFTINQPQPITVSIGASQFEGGFEIDCNGNNSGTAAVAVSGGTAPYSFLWSGPNGFVSASGNIGNLVAGTYCVVVTDAQDCTAEMCIDLEEPQALTAAPDITIPDCAGTLATVDLNVSGGTSPYLFNWGEGNNTEIVQLEEGNYSVAIFDANGCSIVEGISIDLPSEIIVVPTPSQFAGGLNISCLGAADGAISLDVFGGEGNLLAEWTGPNGFASNDGTINNLEPGQYCVIITDEIGCTGDTCITLVEPSAVALSLSASTISCVGGGDGSATASASGGTPAYTISWTGPNGFSATGTSISGLVSGTYCASVTDVNGCFTEECIDVTAPEALDIVLTSPEFDGVNISCFGDNSGSITALITGGTAPYSYLWSGPGGYSSTEENPLNLFAGEYCLSITDAAGCSAETCITLTQNSSLEVQLEALTYPNGTNTSCGGTCDGQIEASIMGGTPPIDLSWSGPNGFSSDQALISGLCAGTYGLTTTDANGCQQTTAIVLVQALPLSITLDSPVFGGGNEISCFGESTGSIFTTVTGGSGNLTYTWDGPDGFSANTADLGSLTAGTYNLQVADEFGCTASASITLSQPDAALSAAVTASDFPSGDNISCQGASDGSISTTVEGGTAPFNYNWNGPDGFTSVSQNISNLGPGDYTLVVEDANSCVFTVNITLTEPDQPLAAELEILNNISCNQGNDGSLIVNAEGGSGNLTILWIGPDNFSSTEFSITDLNQGTYTYSVEDINGCSVSGAVVLNDPPAIAITAEIENAVCDSETGLINISVSNGTAPYNYLWSNGNQNQDLMDIAAGNYSITVTDSEGCTATADFNVGQDNNLELAAEITNLLCNGDSTGIILISAVEGAEPVSYTWTGPNGFMSSADVLTGLAAGTYNVEATDSNGCAISESFEVTQPDAIDISELESPSYSNGFNLSGFRSNDGQIYSPTVLGGTAPYNYIWSSSNGYVSLSPFQNQVNLEAATYQLVVIDANLCSDTATIVLTEPIPLEMPNGISPNGDGFNDGFTVRGLEDYPQNKLMVFNRWGNLVYEESNYRNIAPWQGTNESGEQLPEGTYFVIVELSGTENLKGYLELRR